jgi:hypothetical protein
MMISGMDSIRLAASQHGSMPEHLAFERQSLPTPLRSIGRE